MNIFDGFKVIVDVFNVVLIDPLINILLGLYRLAELAHLPGPFGWSIIFLTVLIRLVVYPLVAQQLIHQKRMADLKPMLSELKKKHGHDPKKHREETQRLYQDQGINPAAGCVPLLIQFPILIGLYNVFFTTLNQDVGKAITHLNSVTYFDWLKITRLDETFLGINLAFNPSHFGIFTPYLLIPILTAILQFVLAKMVQPAVQENVTKDEKSFEEAMASSQSTFIYLMPLMTGYFAFTFPIGLALYWNVANIFAIIQQYLISGPGGLSKWLPKKLIPSK